jgi:predicted RecB family nuclease
MTDFNRMTNKMAASKKQVRTCNLGHQFYKSSDCPTCPTCEGERKPKDNFLSLLVAPARRALENKGITTLQQLSDFSEEEILQLHGMGPSTIPKLKKALKENGLSFKLT